MIRPLIRRSLTTFAAASLLVGGALLPSAPASANPYPTCYGKRAGATFPDNEVAWIPATSASGTSTCDLRMGVLNNDAVKVLQNALNKCNKPQNWAALVVDGDFGQKTKDLLVWAQGERGTTPDGTYGPLTRDALFWPVTTDGSCHQLLPNQL